MMEKLNEREIAQGYAGKPVNREKLLTVSYQNGTFFPEKYPRYVADCYKYEQELLELFGITPILLDRWGYYGIEFSVYIYVDDGRIVNCAIDKFKNTYCGGHGRPSGYGLTPSQQEIRIFRRIMDYISI
jgi:hypothetical protein